MRRAHIYLVGIVALHIGYIILSEATFWRYLPDGDIPLGIRLADPAGYWVALLVLLYLWCRADVKERHIELPFSTMILVPLFFPIGVPYYFWRTYTPRRALARIGLAAAFVVVCIGSSWLAFRLFDRYMLTAA